jgi:hypothetical protein
MKHLLTLACAGLIAGTMLSTPALAQSTNVTDPGHPRVSEIDNRLQDQQTREDNGVKDGQINGKQLTHDDKTDSRVQKQLSRDESKHNGHITKREQRRMNHELNKNSHRIHRQRHHATPAATPASR